MLLTRCASLQLGNTVRTGTGLALLASVLVLLCALCALRALRARAPLALLCPPCLPVLHLPQKARETLARCRVRSRLGASPQSGVQHPHHHPATAATGRSETPDARHETPGTRHQTPDTRHQTPDASASLPLQKRKLIRGLTREARQVERLLLALINYTKFTNQPTAQYQS